MKRFFVVKFLGSFIGGNSGSYAACSSGGIEKAFLFDMFNEKHKKEWDRFNNLNGIGFNTLAEFYCFESEEDFENYKTLKEII